MSLWQSHLFLSKENILQFKYCESSILPVFSGTNLLCRIVADRNSNFLSKQDSLVRPSACGAKLLTLSHWICLLIGLFLYSAVRVNVGGFIVVKCCKQRICFT